MVGRVGLDHPWYSFVCTPYLKGKGGERTPGGGKQRLIIVGIKIFRSASLRLSQCDSWEHRSGVRRGMYVVHLSIYS